MGVHDLTINFSSKLHAKIHHINTSCNMLVVSKKTTLLGNARLGPKEAVASERRRPPESVSGKAGGRQGWKDMFFRSDLGGLLDSVFLFSCPAFASTQCRLAVFYFPSFEN